MALGANVKKFREAAGLTQTQLADRARIDQQALSVLEKRDSKSSKFTAQIAGALGKTVDELLGLDNAGLSPIPANFVDADDIVKMIQVYANTSPSGRAIMMRATATARDMISTNKRSSSSN